MGYNEPLELAWAAGFFDGEGCTSIRNDKRPGRNKTVQLHIEQTDAHVLARFAAAVSWDGRIYTRSPRPDNRKTLFRIAMGHADTVETMKKLWPYLSAPKQAQFIYALRDLEDSPHAFA